MIFLLFLFQDALPPPPPPPPQSSTDGAAYSLAAGQRPSPSISDQSGRQRPTVWVIKTAPHTNVSSGLHIISIGCECKSCPSCLGEYVHRWSDWWSPGSHCSSSPSPLTSEPSQLPSLLLLCSTQLIRVRSPHSCLFLFVACVYGCTHLWLQGLCVPSVSVNIEIRRQTSQLRRSIILAAISGILRFSPG